MSNNGCGCGPSNNEIQEVVDSCAEESTSRCACEPTTRRTYCDGDTTNNVWVEGVDEARGAVGICLLDTMKECQVINVLQRDERARADLLRVTTDPRLRELAMTVAPLPSYEEEDRLQTTINNNPGSIPFYTVFRGNAPYSNKG